LPQGPQPRKRGYRRGKRRLRAKQAVPNMAEQAGRSEMKQDGKGGQAAGKAAKDKRQERLKLALRENLKRRKSQARKKGDFPAASPGPGEVARDRGKNSAS
jgi:hypothetical protein